ncbi:hypothetical protein [Peribacillus simplex]
MFRDSATLKSSYRVRTKMTMVETKEFVIASYLSLQMSDNGI